MPMLVIRFTTNYVNETWDFFRTEKKNAVMREIPPANQKKMMCFLDPILLRGSDDWSDHGNPSGAPPQSYVSPKKYIRPYDQGLLTIGFP